MNKIREQVRTSKHTNQQPASPRVLFAVGILGKNGITTNIKTLAEGMQARGWEVAVACGEIVQGAPVDAAYLRSRGIRRFRIPFPDFIRSSKSLIKAIKALIEMHAAVRAYQPDVIHIHGFGIAPFAYVSRYLHGVPVVSTCQITPPARTVALARKLSFVNGWLNGILGDRVVAISEELQEIVQDLWKVPPERIRLIHHGADSVHFRPPSEKERAAARAFFGLQPDDKAICIVGRLFPVKGHHLLVKALAQLRSERIPAVALCAGVGPLQESIEELAEALGVADHVRMLGFTDTRRVLWASDAFALPSRREGCPLVIAEAMLCGVVPVRTPAGGAASQIKDGSNGFIVPFGDHEMLALRLKQLIQDPSLQSRMSRRSVKSARQKFTADRMVEKTLAMYDELSSRDSRNTVECKTLSCTPSLRKNAHARKSG